jgi:hypothetical protein
VALQNVSTVYPDRWFIQRCRADWVQARHTRNNYSQLEQRIDYGSSSANVSSWASVCFGNKPEYYSGQTRASSIVLMGCRPRELPCIKKISRSRCAAGSGGVAVSTGTAVRRAQPNRRTAAGGGQCWSHLMTFLWRLQDVVPTCPSAKTTKGKLRVSHITCLMLKPVNEMREWQ